MEKSNSKDIKKSKEIKTFSLSEDFIIRVNKSDVTALNNNSIKYGSFSETTTASFSADMTLGATDGDTTTEATAFDYQFQLGLNTSFTGEDSLSVNIVAGNTTGAKTSDDKLTVDGIANTFPLGSSMRIDTDGSTRFTTDCAYGGPTNTLDDCGNVNAGITGGETNVGASYDSGSGFTAAIGYSDNKTDTKEDSDTYGINATYTADNLSFTLAYNKADDSYPAINGYSTQGSMTISAGYETGNIVASGEYDFDNGFTVGSGIVSYGNETEITKEDSDTYGIHVAYTADNYGVSLKSSTTEDSLALTDSEALSYIASNNDLILALGTDIEAAKSHYINSGHSEGRIINFDGASYLASNTDLMAAFGSDTTAATEHYINYGYSEGRSVDSFDEWGYLASNTDLMAAFGSDTTLATQHYIDFGHSEGRSVDSFNAQNYLAKYDDLQSAFGSDTRAAVQHFVEKGYGQGRTDIINEYSMISAFVF